MPRCQLLSHDDYDEEDDGTLREKNRYKKHGGRLINHDNEEIMIRNK